MNLHPKHYPLESWADFVRQILGEGDRAAMQLHLDSGCPQCGQDVDWLRSVTAAAAAGMPVEPPPELIQRARAIFTPSARPVPEPSATFEQLETLIAELIFVSTGDLLPLGVRGGSAVGERLVYRAGGLLVDLTMDEGLTFNQAGEIIGQVTSEEVATELGGLVVQLRSGAKVLGETETNQFGEFVLQRPLLKSVTLRIILSRAGKKIEVRLRRERDKK